MKVRLGTAGEIYAPSYGGAIEFDNAKGFRLPATRAPPLVPGIFLTLQLGIMLTILYQDDHYVAVDKPSGIFVHPTRLGPREPNCMARLGRQLGRPVYTIHRLDRATSGVLLFALSSEAAREMCVLFEERRIQKEYLAVVRGFAPEAGRIDHPLRKEKKKPAVEAVTHYVRIGTVELQEPVGRHETARFSLVRAVPQTGRMHQIRRHMAHISHPVLGDTRYGDGAQNRFFRARFGMRRLALMASRLAFRHPYTCNGVAVVANPSEDLQATFAGLGWDGSLPPYPHPPLDSLTL